MAHPGANAASAKRFQANEVRIASQHRLSGALHTLDREAVRSVGHERLKPAVHICCNTMMSMPFSGSLNLGYGWRGKLR